MAREPRSNSSTLGGTQFERLPLVILFLALLACLQVALVEASRDISAVEEEASSHRAEARRLPHTTFTRDWFNRVHGSVVSASGLPLAGVQVKIFDSAALESTVREAIEAKWPVPEWEAITFTGPSGEYEFTDLEYGAKCLAFSRKGWQASTVSDVVLLDGMRLEFNTILTETESHQLRLMETSGQPAGNIPVTILPVVWGILPREARTNADGWLSVPGELWASERDGELLVGDPPVLVKIGLNPIRQEHVLPASQDFTIVLEGARKLQPIQIDFYPEQALRAGHRRFEFVPTENEIHIAGIRRGAFGLLARQDDAAAWSWIDRKGARAKLVFHSVRPLTVELTHHVEGQLVNVPGHPVHWEPDPPMPRPLKVCTPREWLDRSALLTATQVTSPEGRTELQRCAGPGYLTVYGDQGRASVRKGVSPAEAFVRIVLPSAEKVYVRGARPFMPVVITQNGVSAFGRCDQYAEEGTWAVRGPLTVISGFPKGHLSYPRGLWVGLGKPQIDFMPLDEAIPQSLCLFGFVVTPQGGPRAGARVRVRGSDTNGDWYSMTDDNGFYRIAGLNAGSYRVAIVNDKGRESPDQEFDVAEGYIRRDLVLWLASLEVSPLPASGRLTLSSEEEGAIWTSDVLEGTEVGLCGIPPGQYRFELAVEGLAIVRSEVVAVPPDATMIRVRLEAPAITGQADPAFER